MLLRRLLGTAAIVGIVLAGTMRPAAADDDKTTAHALFLAGQKAFHAGDYKTAGSIFEEAYRKKPHHDALWNAASAWNRAGEDVRAANLYAKYLREAPTSAQDRKAAGAALGTLTSKLGKVVVHAPALSDVKVDETPSDPDGLFVAPGEHVVSGRSGDVPVKKTVTLAAGQTLEVTLEPPPPPPKKPEPAPPPPPRKEERFHLPWVVVAIGGALAITGGGVTLWSGLDSSTKRERFRDRVDSREATKQELDDGRATQFRTNILLGATIGVTALTGVAALFVDWGGTKSGGLFVRPALGHVTVGYRH
ncbi:MAG: hypothetical protein KIT84_14300 [Labilithrix sp.]|nr:hypothetical protein [Labilithrix sp.]MCW5812193.1 hypothetical protein [Labilithrix sp.]